MRHPIHPRFRLVAGLAGGVALLCSSLASTAPAQSTAGLTQYTIGNPSGDETEILCEINRARANPPAEGQRLVDAINAVYPNHDSGIDLGLLRSQFQGYPTRPPLAFNAKLNASAQAHTADMIATGVQQHNSSDGTPFGFRIMSFGYSDARGENVTGSANSLVSVQPWTTEGSYETDTAEPNLGHRINVMEPTLIGSVEIGVAQRALGGWNTEDFGANATPPLVTGVVFTDSAGTGFYASGEGVGGVTVTAPGASTSYAVTTASGAYTLPLDLVAAYAPAAALPAVQIVFTDAAGNSTTTTVTLGHTTDTNGDFYVEAADDAAGTYTTRYDNAEADLVLPAAAAAHPAFFAGETALSQGVYYLAFPASGNVFGYYGYLGTPGFLYHFDLGYEYVVDAQDAQSGVYLYDFASGGWFYTSPGFPFPYLYDFRLNSTVYYYPDPSHPGRYNTDGVRYFYVFATRQIIAK